ncbi:MAG: sterol desaturase/sphingolipid hydroxylase (fatty acid hydroxylase superfamily) [Candidatus Azotimanducaceae bacterium]|jgi:sterol desaturase/sphingolipid hydroxylase (fatty acid hydroxylase superfamily)
MSVPRALLFYGLQPLLIIGVLGAWLMDPALEATFLVGIVAVQVVLGVLEHYWPARPTWVVHAKEKLLNIFLVSVLVVLGVVVAELYSAVLAEPLQQFRQVNGLDLWPHEWPLLVQLLMAFIASEFIWYWIHRSEHRWYAVWRLSGHGAHHSFKRLNALNFGLNHPLELFFLAVPPAIIELLFGVGYAAAGAALLIVTQASIVHSNFDLNSKVIGWLFTTNRYHIHHHSSVMAESNTNYGCAGILWDRVFGTFADADTEEAGTGPTEPSLWQKFVMPVKEPEDTAVAPG